MTTIHAVPRGTRAGDNRFLPLTLHAGSGHPVALLAPVDELQTALRETGGVGRFEFQIGDDPAVHHAIAKRIVPGAAPGTFRHIELQEVAANAIVRMQVVLKVAGLPASAQAVQRKRHVVVKAPLRHLPEAIRVDLSHLEAGASFRAKDLPLPEGVQLSSPPEEELFVVRPFEK